MFVQTPFSHSTLKIEKKMQAAKPLAFLLHFLFRREQKHNFNLTSKIMKMCEQILKKHSQKSSENASKWNFTQISFNYSIDKTYLHQIRIILKQNYKRKKIKKTNLLKYDKKSDRNLSSLETPK